MGVDAWLTEDQMHVAKMASNRTPAKESRSDGLHPPRRHSSRVNVEFGEKQPGKEKDARAPTGR
jgi:hypothetical protein